VADSTHDAEDAFHEIQLSGKQLVFLGMMGTVVLVAVFLCGVLVGRNARSPRDGEPLETAAAPSAASPSPQAGDAGPAAAEPPAPPAEDELSYHKRLQGNPPPDELKPKPQETPAPAPEAAAKPPAPAPPAEDVPTTGRPGEWFVQVIASQSRPAAADIVRSLISKGYPAYLELPAGGTGLYRVRVGRFNDRREADQTARRLKEDKFTADVRR
jgi:cell division septation protein DedD